MTKLRVQRTLGFSQIITCMSPDPKPNAPNPGPARKQVLEQERWERTDAVASEVKGFWAHMVRIQVTRGHSTQGDRRRCQSCTSRKSSQHNFITITLHADTACDGKSAKSKLYNEQIAGASSVSMTVGIMRECWDIQQWLDTSKLLLPARFLKPA